MSTTQFFTILILGVIIYSLLSRTYKKKSNKNNVSDDYDYIKSYELSRASVEQSMADKELKSKADKAAGNAFTSYLDCRTKWQSNPNLHLIPFHHVWVRAPVDTIIKEFPPYESEHTSASINKYVYDKYKELVDDHEKEYPLKLTKNRYMQDNKEQLAPEEQTEIPNTPFPPSTTANRPLSPGEEIMGVSFNPGGRQDVNDLKHWCASMYDWLNNQPIKLNGGRLKAIAQTFLETYQMNIVKSVTYLPMFSRELIDNLKSPISTPTEGQLACTVDFNVSVRTDVAHIKNKCAAMYDNCIRIRELSKTYIEGLVTESNNIWAKKEQERLDALTDEEKDKEFNENYGNRNYTTPPWSQELILESRKQNEMVGALGDAMYALRQFQMYAVKAVTQ